jgi:hypothetical protein
MKTNCKFLSSILDFFFKDPNIYLHLFWFKQKAWKWLFLLEHMHAKFAKCPIWPIRWFLKYNTDIIKNADYIDDWFWKLFVNVWAKIDLKISCFSFYIFCLIILRFCQYFWNHCNISWYHMKPAHIAQPLI